MLKIKSVEPESIGHELGLVPGDIIISFNQCPARDIIDYYFNIAGEELSLRVKTSNGELVDFDIEKEYQEDLGLEFVLRARQCGNKCVFCFIDQQPPNMRSTLYIKDDDYRLSFLHGNYITLTNLRQKDIQRITTERLSPLYVSIHATDPGVRARLLGKTQDFDIMKTLSFLHNSGIDFHGQIVLCPGYNDGEVLAQTLGDLAGLGDSFLSLAVVPVGLTRHREHLTPLRSVDNQTAREVIGIIDDYQQRFLKSKGRRVVFAADEFFIRAELPVPPIEYYEDFAQLENGIGLVRKTLMQTEELKLLKVHRTLKKKIMLITGKAAVESVRTMCAGIMTVFPDIQVSLYGIENKFLGSQITVAGLLAGKDILDFAVEGNQDWDILLVPEVSVRADCFIDDYSLENLSQSLDKPVYAAGDVFDIVNIIRNEVL